MFVKQYNSSYYYYFNWTPLYVLLYNKKTFIHQSVHIFLGATVSMYQPSISLFPTQNLCLDRGKFENIFWLSWLTETTVLLFSAVNGSICLELQMKALSTVQLRYDPLQLGLCKETEGRERENEKKTGLNRHCHSESVRGFKAPGLARAFHGLQIWACITNKRSDHSDRRTGTNIYIYLHVEIVPRVTTQKIGESCNLQGNYSLLGMIRIHVNM